MVHRSLEPLQELFLFLTGRPTLCSEHLPILALPPLTGAYHTWRLQVFSPLFLPPWAFRQLPFWPCVTIPTTHRRLPESRSPPLPLSMGSASWSRHMGGPSPTPVRQVRGQRTLGPGEGHPSELEDSLGKRGAQAFIPFTVSFSGLTHPTG